MSNPTPSLTLKLYTDLSSWFHLLTSPEDYAEESEFSRATLQESARIPVRDVLELGSGGGNNALHLKDVFKLTLVDRSPGMLDVSRRINPECEHLEGDMRTVRLNREFDAVLIHDAVMYMTTQADLLECMRTASAHCRSGGVALFLPDMIRETFQETAHHGGHDGVGRSLRYIEWTFDPDPSDSTYTVDFGYMLREGRGPVRVEHEPHVFGLFGREEWLNLLREAGFEPRVVTDLYDREIFIAVKP